jgi:biopolymer transport protein ExbB/TolQ
MLTIISWMLTAFLALALVVVRRDLRTTQKRQRVAEHKLSTCERIRSEYETALAGSLLEDSK